MFSSTHASKFGINSLMQGWQKTSWRRFISRKYSIIGRHLKLEHGQPTPDTHPHLLKPGELVPGFLLSEFLDRREILVKRILQQKPGWNHVVIIPSAEIQYMSKKIPYIFRQNTDFRYLTGCLEPDSALMFVINENSVTRSIMFVREKNQHAELWEGPRTGVEKAPKMFGVDESYPVSDFVHILKSMKSLGKLMVWYDIYEPIHANIHKAVISFMKDTGMKDLENPILQVHKQRIIKSPSEQIVMRKAGSIASAGIQKAMEVTKPGITEHQLFAEVDYQCRIMGAEFLAYPPVVATGNNANIIHYINNTQQIHKGEMILMDAGCELHGYCSDITRTWPASGEFTDAQRTLYDILFSVQTYLVSKCSETITLDDLFNHMCQELGKRLKEAHILSKSAQAEELEKIAFKLCPHHVSHYLGMDVHDTGSINRNILIKPGMVFTVEPGLYIDRHSTLTKPEFRGHGLRIEDDVLITSTGPEILSTCPKDRKTIEKVANSSEKYKSG